MSTHFFFSKKAQVNQTKCEQFKYIRIFYFRFLFLIKYAKGRRNISFTTTNRKSKNPNLT